MPAAEPWRPPLALRASAGLHGTAAALLALRPEWWPWLGEAVLGNHLVLGAAGMWPRSRLLGPNLQRIEGVSRVALTFDDGPDPWVTPRVLDLLGEAGVRATFFCIGTQATRHSALVRRAQAEGHAIGNHSHTHPNGFAFLAGPALRRQVTDAQAALADITGVAPSWFRAPMGFRNPLLDPVLHHAGLRLVSWTRRGYDTRDGDAGRVLQRLTRRVRGGDILLLHDGRAARTDDGAPVVLRVLPRLLQRLHAAGLTPSLLPGATAAKAGGAGSQASAGYAST